MRTAPPRNWCFDHVVVGHYMAGLIPDRTAAALGAALLAGQLTKLVAAGSAHDLHHRGRHVLEKLDGRSFGIREHAPRLDRPRRRGRIEPVLDIGPQHHEAQHDQDRQEKQSNGSIFHENLRAWRDHPAHSRTATARPNRQTAAIVPPIASIASASLHGSTPPRVIYPSP